MAQTQQGGRPKQSALPESGLIRSKLSPGRLPNGIVPRPTLLERLSAGHQRALTLVSAPAGFGKTTLISEWASGSASVAWVSLDKGDTDPARFWGHVIAALATTEPHVGTTSLAAVKARPEEVEKYALPKLLDELLRDGPDLAIILDDYHLAETGQLNSSIEAFMHYRPSRIQLVISTRSDPALGVARLRASGSLVEIRAGDLRFDDREVAAFLQAVGVEGLSEGEQRSLADRTGGWPAPLRLLALLIPERDRGRYLASLTRVNRPVVDYLATDVLDLLGPEVREFVLRTSVLGRMNAALCDAVVGTPGSGAILAELERSNLFVSVNDTGEWYQLHHLFAAVLRLELHRTRPELVSGLHLRAARWFEDAGDLETATAHAIASRDLDVATRLVALQASQLASAGRWATLRGWLSELSWPEAQAHPELAFIRATGASFVHDLDLAEQWLDVAETGPPDLIGSMGLPLGYRTDFLRALVGVNDVDQAEAAARRAIESAPAPQWEGVALACLGQVQYLRGHYARARDTLLKAVGLIPDANPNLLTLAIGNLALAEYADGSASHAAAMLDDGIELIRSIGQERTPSGGILHLACGERARAGGDPRGALTWFESAADVFGQGTRSAWLANTHLLQARAFHALSDEREETRCLGLADAVIDRLPNPGALPTRAEQLHAQPPRVSRHLTEFGEELSSREIVVLQLAADGLTQREIADQLFISYNTVKTHLKATYRKLGATSRDDALSRYARPGAARRPRRRPPEGSPG
jgi:LuxR family maltose regulon positive regulatory protein